MKIEVVGVPVSDVDRAKEFYKALGWREDADRVGDDNFRIVQFTPPGSACSIHFGTGILAGPPGSTQGVFLVVEDIEAARAELIAAGANVSGVVHNAAGALSLPADVEARAPGPDPEGRSYASYATFTDPDGNGWVLQQVTTRLPGR